MDSIPDISTENPAKISTERDNLTPETDKPKSPLFDVLQTFMKLTQRNEASTSSTETPSDGDASTIAERVATLFSGVEDKSPLVNEMLKGFNGMMEDAAKNGVALPSMIKLLEQIMSSRPVFHSPKRATDTTKSAEKPVLNLRLGKWTLIINSQSDDDRHRVQYQQKGLVIHEKTVTSDQVQRVICDLAANCNEPLRFRLTWNMTFVDERVLNTDEAADKKILKRTVRYFLALI